MKARIWLTLLGLALVALVILRVQAPTQSASATSTSKSAIKFRAASDSGQGTVVELHKGRPKETEAERRAEWFQARQTEMISS